MGHLTLSKIGLIVVGALALASCNPQGSAGGQGVASDTSAGAEAAMFDGGGGGVTIICPGDRRCADIEPPPGFTPAQPADPSAAPRVATCLVIGEVAVLRCGDEDRRCPGPGCPGGQDPGSDSRQCRMRDTYVWLNCDRRPLDGGAPPAAEPPAAETP